MYRRAAHSGRSRSPSSPPSTHPDSLPCPTDRPRSNRRNRPDTFRNSPSVRDRIRAETRPPPGPIPPRSAGDRCPSSGSATTHTPARRPSSRTPPDGDPSAESRGRATKRPRSPCNISRPRRRPSPTRTRDTLPPSLRSGPSPDCRRARSFSQPRQERRVVLVRVAANDASAMQRSPPTSSRRCRPSCLGPDPRRRVAVAPRREISIRMSARGGRQPASVGSRLSQSFGHHRQWCQRREALATIAPRSGARGVSRRRTCGGRRRP